MQAHLENTEPIRNRRVDVHGFLGDAATLMGWHRIEGTHVVQAIGELDQDHPQVLGHCHGHLLKVFGLGFGPRAEVDLVQLANAIDQFGDFIAELGGELFLERGRIFDDVVQDRGDDTAAVHAHLRENTRDRNRMTDIGFTGHPALTFVGLGANQVGAINFLDLRRLEIGLELSAQIRNTGLVVTDADIAGNDFKQIGVVRPHHTPER